MKNVLMQQAQSRGVRAANAEMGNVEIPVVVKRWGSSATVGAPAMVTVLAEVKFRHREGNILVQWLGVATDGLRVNKYRGGNRWIEGQ